MFVYKKLKASDAGILAFEAHKSYTEGNSTYTLYDSSYSSASKDTYSLTSNDPNNHKKFFQLDHLFYREAPFKLGSLNGGLNYVNQEKHLFEDVKIISISQKDIGNGIQKETLQVGAYRDDGKGNLYIGSTALSQFPEQKDRVFYLGPVYGYRHKDLTINLANNLPLVNSPDSYFDNTYDDSLFTNPVEYISCSIEDMSGDLAGFTGINLNTGYVKVAHRNHYNFGDEDFTICFWYDPESTSGTRYIFSKSFTKTVANSPTFPKSTENSGSFGKQEVDAGPSSPFEIFANGTTLVFRRKDPDNVSQVTTTLSSGLTHYTFVKDGATLKIYKDGSSPVSAADTTVACKTKADLFIGSKGGTRGGIDPAGGLISQINIFSKALSADEVSNIYDTKTGSPFVGNVFYEQGIVTITRPDQTRAGFTTLAENTATITLKASDYNASIVGAGITSDVQTFTADTSFFNEELMVFGLSIFGDERSAYTNIKAQIEADSTLTLETDTYSSDNSYTIEIGSAPDGTYGDPFKAGRIASESLHPQAPFDGTGNTNEFVLYEDTTLDVGTDSTASIYEYSPSGKSFILGSNKFITASFDIDAPSTTTHFSENWLRLQASNYIGVTTATFEDNTNFNLSGENIAVDGFNDGGALTQNDGGVLLTGSAGDTPFFGYKGVPFTRLINDNPSDYYDGISFEFVDGNNNGSINAGNFLEQIPVNISSTNYSKIFVLESDTRTSNPLSEANQGAYFETANNADGTDIRDGKIYFGHGIDAGYFSLNYTSDKVLFNPPSTVYPYIKIRDLKKNPSSPNTPTIRPKYRINGGSWIYTNWFFIGSAVNPLTGQAISFTSNQDVIFTNALATSGLSQGDYIELGFDTTTLGGGFSNIRIEGDIYIGLTNGHEWSSTVNVGFDNDTQTTGPNLTTKVEITSDLYPINTNDLVVFKMPGNITGTDDGGNPFSIGPKMNLTRHSGSLSTLTLEQFEGDGSSKYGNQSPVRIVSSDIEGARITVFLESGKQVSGDLSQTEILDSVISNIDGDLANISLQGIVENGQHTHTHVRIAITDSEGNVLYTRATQGMVLGNDTQGLANLKSYISSDNFTISNINADSDLLSSGDLSVLFGKHKETLDQTSLTDGGSFYQSMSFDNTLYILSGSTPEYITSMSNAGTPSDTHGDTVHFDTPILITSSIGVTASYEAGALVSASYETTSTLERGLYEVRDVIINTSPGLLALHQFFNPGESIPEIAPNTNVTMEVYVNGALVDTKQTLVTGDGRINLCDQEIDHVKLGFIHTDIATGGTDTASFHFFTSNPSDANDRVEIREGQGFVVESLTLTRITSSNELRLHDNTSFENHLSPLSPENADEVRFISPHLDRGAISFPFTYDNSGVNFTASINSWNDDYTVAYLDTEYLITTSFDTEDDAQFYSVGPFPLSAYFDITLPAYQFGELSYSFNTGFSDNDRNASLYQFLNSDIFGDSYISETPSDPNSGIGVRIYKGHNSNTSNIVAEAYNASNTFGGLNNSQLLEQISEIHRYNVDTTNNYRIQFLLSGSSTTDYPNGIVTGSDDTTLTITNFYLQGKKLSGSKISSDDPGTWDSTTKLILTSSHVNGGTHGLFTTGKQIIQGISEAAGGEIIVPNILFITGTLAEVTGAKVEISEGEEVYSYLAWPNSAVPTQNVTSNLIGGTFVYNETTYTITDIGEAYSEDSSYTLIELNSGQGSITTTLNDDLIDLDQNASVTYYTVANASGFNMAFKNTHLIFENEFHCTVDESEFTHTLNTSARKYRSADHGELAAFATGSNFRPYVTTVGLYNDEGELLVVGKLAQPVRMSEETDTTFVVRYDT